jgi:hypothetical protein
MTKGPTMAITIPNVDAEAIVNLWKGSDLYVAAHIGDPGKIGANPATGLPRVLLASASGYTAFVDDATSGGRLTDNAAVLDFGLASVAETYTHLGLWSAATGGTFRGGGPLVTAKSAAVNEPVTIPIGNLDLVGAGGS